MVYKWSIRLQYEHRGQTNMIETSILSADYKHAIEELMATVDSMEGVKVIAFRVVRTSI